MGKYHLKRREFLDAMKLGLGMLPVLPMLSHAEAAAPKRFLQVMNTGGAVLDQFWPTGPGADLTTRTFGSITKPLEKYAAQLTFFKGLTQKNFLDNFPPYGPSRGNNCGPSKNLECKHGGAHESYACLFSAKAARPKDTGEVRGFMSSEATGPSLDQYVGRSIASAGGPNPLVLGVVMNKQIHGPTQSYCSHLENGNPQVPEDDTKKLFDTYFANRTNGPSPEMEKIRLRKASLLDEVGKDLERFSARVSTEYKYKVDGHLTAIRDLEKTLSGQPSSAACNKPSLPTFDPKNLGQYNIALEAQLRFVAAAFACDIARVISLQLANAHADEIVFSWLGIQGGGQEFPVRNFHDIQHRPGDDKPKVENWFMSQFALLLEQMTQTKEGVGTLLDNSAILWANHMSNGGAHDSVNLPWILAGKCGGALKTGQFVELPNDTHTGVVLTALAKAMGVPADSKFADDRYNQPLARILT
jgi:hypothetical protein